jgi:hypothetical protein
MDGVLEISLGTASGWITPHSYGVVLHEVDRSLAELDRLAVAERRRRAMWRVVNTGWATDGPTITLRPDVGGDARSMEELMRPSLALVGGVRQLHTEPEIPQHFSETIVGRISKVAAQVGQRGTGLDSVSLRTIGTDARAAAIDDVVSANASLAIASASIAYGSVMGTLDLITTRGGRNRVGLLVDYGPPVLCVVDKLDRVEYIQGLDQRVIVSGLLKRNGRGQIVRIDADELELAPRASSVSAASLRGAIPGGPEIADFIREQRGR